MESKKEFFTWKNFVRFTEYSDEQMKLAEWCNEVANVGVQPLLEENAKLRKALERVKAPPSPRRK